VSVFRGLTQGVTGPGVPHVVAADRSGRRDVPIWPLIAVPAIVVIAVALTFGQTRYRAPAEPVVVLLAAVAADAWLRRRAARRPTGHERDAEAARAPEPGTVSSPA
jgi:hypothetical protein